MANPSESFPQDHDEDQMTVSLSEVTAGSDSAHALDVENEDEASVPSPEFDPDHHCSEMDSQLELLKRHHQEIIRGIERQQAQLKENHILRNEVTRLTRDLGETRAKSEHFEQQLNKMRQDAVRMPTQLFWEPEDEQRVYSEIQGLHSDIRRWAKVYSLKDASAISAPAGSSAREYLLKIVRMANKKICKSLRSDKMSSRLAYLLLAAMVSRGLYQNLLRNPFSFFSHLPDANHTTKHTLRDSYNVLLKHDIVKANLWRATNLQTLLPQAHSFGAQHDEQLRTKDMAQKAIKAECQYIATFMLKDPCQAFLAKIPEAEVDKRLEGLQDIFERAGALFSRLHTQRFQLTCALLEDFQDTPFNVSSREMQAHSLRKLDEDDTSLDGHAIAMVIYPAVHINGTSDGRDYDKKRTLSKAVVWVDE